MMLRLAGVVALIVGVSWLGLASSLAAEPTSRPTSSPAQWPLPKMERIDPMSFSVAADGRSAVVVGQQYLTKGNNTSVTKTPFLVDLVTAKTVNLLDLLGEEAGKQIARVSDARLSPDGRHATIRAVSTSGEMRLWIIDLAQRKPQLVGKGQIVMPCWTGGKLAIGSADTTGTIGPIMLFDPAKAAGTPMKLCGFLAATDSKGTVLCCMANPKDLTKPLSMRDARPAMLVLTPDGKILRQLGSEDEVGTPPIISDGGKYLAFQYVNRAAGPASGIRVDVLASQGEEKWSLKELAMPMFVDDTGRVVTLGASFDLDGAPITLWNKSVKAQVLVPKAWAAAVVGGNLYYVVGRESAMTIQMKPLPK